MTDNRFDDQWKGVLAMVRLKITCALLVLTASASISAESNARPSLFGLSLAYPQQVPELVTVSNLPYFRAERMVPFILDIDNKGQVTTVTSEDSIDMAFAEYAEAWIKSFRFEPATFNGEKTESRLPVILQFRPQVRLPEVHFPLDSNRVVVDTDLYFKAFWLNNIHLPQLDKFPSYFCDLKQSDSSVIYKYILIRVGLDELGQVTNVELVRSSFPAFNMHIISAVLWADFSPATVHGTPVPSECFVLVSFFPRINYPTSVWCKSKLDSVSLLERFRIRLLPDTVGMMAKPVPVLVQGSELTLTGKYLLIRDTVSASLHIDTNGVVILRRFGKVGKRMRSTVREVAARLRFFPAYDYQGRPHPFSGLVSLVFQGSSRIRILYLWLPADNFYSKN